MRKSLLRAFGLICLFSLLLGAQTMAQQGAECAPQEAEVKYAYWTGEYYANDRYAVFDCKSKTHMNTQGGAGKGIGRICINKNTSAFDISAQPTGRFYTEYFQIFRCPAGMLNVMGGSREGISKLCFPGSHLDNLNAPISIFRAQETGKMYHNNRFKVYSCGAGFVNMDSGTHEGISPYCIRFPGYWPRYTNAPEPQRRKSDRISGDVGKFIGSAVEYVGVQPILKFIIELDELHGTIKEYLPYYRIQEEVASRAAREIGRTMCLPAFEAIVNPVIASCSNYSGRTGNMEKITEAKLALWQKGFFKRSEFDGVTFRWCPLLRGSGIAPDRDLVYLDVDYQRANLKELSALIAHEMEHVRQYRRLGTDAFKCLYAREFTKCHGCQDDRHPLERDARVTERLVESNFNCVK